MGLRVGQTMETQGCHAGLSRRSPQGKGGSLGEGGQNRFFRLGKAIN